MKRKTKETVATAAKVFDDESAIRDAQWKEEGRKASRQDLAERLLLQLIATKQWSHEALVRNAIELTDRLLEGLDDTY